jgi:ADP-glucose pyrophosphorylase
MIETHLKNNADLTIATIVIEKERASAFGIMEVDETGRIINFKEKPKDPPTLKDDPSKCLASMGVYIFNPNTLVELLTHDAEVSTSSHDFGKDVIPYQFIMAIKFIRINSETRMAVSVIFRM